MREVVLGARGAAAGLPYWQPLGLGLLGIGLSAGAAATERVIHPVTGPYWTLLGAVFGIAVPLYSFALVTKVVLERRHGHRSGWSRFGVNRKRYALGELAPAVGWSAMFAATAGLVAVGCAGAPTSAGSIADVLSAVWIGICGALLYCLLFAAAGTWMGGRGAGVVLIFDWLLGSGSGAWSAVWPRAHLRSLLGGEPILDLSQAASCAVVGVLVAVFLALLLARTPS